MKKIVLTDKMLYKDLLEYNEQCNTETASIAFYGANIAYEDSADENEMFVEIEFLHPENDEHITCGYVPEVLVETLQAELEVVKLNNDQEDIEIIGEENYEAEMQLVANAAQKEIKKLKTEYPNATFEYSTEVYEVLNDENENKAKWIVVVNYACIDCHIPIPIDTEVEETEKENVNTVRKRRM